MLRTQLMFSFLMLFALFISAVFADENNRGFDHRAHAVTGGPYEVPDVDGDGEALITLNGELSHSHYFNETTETTGRIKKYKWTTADGRTICSQILCVRKFPIGRTVVTLTVTDNTGDVASASTFVRVYKGASPGVRVLFYPGNGWIPDKRTEPPRASFSQTLPTVKLNNAGSFPSSVANVKFSIRVLGNIEFFKSGRYSFRLGCGGASCTFWVDSKQILAGSHIDIHSQTVAFTEGVRTMEIVYRRQNSNGPTPRLLLSWKPPGSPSWFTVPAKYLSHNPGLYAPVIHRVRPEQGLVGSTIVISGSSFVNVRSVSLGGTSCVAPVAKNQFTINCIVPGGRGEKMVSVNTKNGMSNSVKFTILPRGSNRINRTGSDEGPIGYYQPIKFSKGFLIQNGKVWKKSQLTTIVLGPDGKYYMGSLNGIVHVVTTDLGRDVQNVCSSPKVGTSRSILGLAFNPAENGKLRLYASTSILYWGTKKLLPFIRGWNNGEVIAMQKKNGCIAKVRTIVSGLPVSNYDHSVNGLSFDNWGNLMISVGGTTNAGVSVEGGPLGGIPDSPLSGAVLQAPVLKRGFNGKIVYSQYGNPHTARKVSGDVRVYAAGLRNSFSNVVHSNGNIYALDNGANSKFGARSTGCNTETNATGEPDTLKKLRPNGFFGYANRNRGRFDTRQCIHRPPQKNIGNYDRHIATFKSSMNGLVEYTANTFGAQMRGDLLATKFAVSGSGIVFRVQLNKKGNVKSKFEIAKHSGLSAAMSATGGLFMPRVYQSKVATLMPIERNPGRLVVTSVNPFRGPRRGGGKVTITGWNLFPPLVITFGGKECRKLENFNKGRSLTCIVPAGQGKAAVIASRLSSSSRSFGFEYVYMNV